MKPLTTLSRRDFVSTAGAALAAPLILTRMSHASTAANEQISVGFIGMVTRHP
jgi:hypothetical protein